MHAWDWEDVDALLSDAADAVSDAVSDPPTDDVEKIEKNRKRRLNEVERLHKYSWERIEQKPIEGKKRSRFTYINRASGVTATSLRQALQHCRPVISNAA